MVEDESNKLSVQKEPPPYQNRNHHKFDDNNNGNIFDNDDETAHLESVCAAYRQYAKFAMCQWASHEYRLKSLPESQQKILPSSLRFGTHAYSQRFKDYKDAVIRNQFCLDCILRHAGQPHSQQQRSHEINFSRNVTDDQVSKVTSVLKSLSRDWSVEGELERTTAYGPIKTLVRKYMPLRVQRSPKIVVPGSGVGRLAFDLAAMGYSVQGNEFSLYMLLASDFVLNNGGRICSPDYPVHLSPWLLESRNVHAFTDSLRQCQIPDVNPVEILLPACNDEQISSAPLPEFSMAAGDFNIIYNNEGEEWDCVASCFFLDACPNIIETLHVIHKMLKPGGLFVNLGPLLYHWSGPPMNCHESLDGYRRRYDHLDDRYLTSINLCYDDIKEIMDRIGFEILEEQIGIECYYTADRRSMMSTKYQCVSFAAKKKAHQP